MIKNLLKELGVPQHVLGYEYLVQATQMVIDDKSVLHKVTTQMYPAIAQTHGTTAQRVERAIRNAVQHVFDNTNNMDVKQRIFGNSIKAETGKPTNAHFIAALVEELKSQAVVV